MRPEPRLTQNEQKFQVKVIQSPFIQNGNSKYTKNVADKFSLDDLFLSLKDKVTKNENEKPRSLHLVASDLYKNNIDFVPKNLSKIKSLDDQMLNKKRLNDHSKLLCEQLKPTQPDLLKKIPAINGITKEDNNSLSESSTVCSESFGSSKSLKEVIYQDETSQKIGKPFQEITSNVISCSLSKLDALLTCLTLKGFTYRHFPSTKKIYLEITKKASVKLKYILELERSTLRILYVEKSSDDRMQCSEPKNVDFDKFIKYEINKQ